MYAYQIIEKERLKFARAIDIIRRFRKRALLQRDRVQSVHRYVQRCREKRAKAEKEMIAALISRYLMNSFACSAIRFLYLRQPY